MSTWSDRAEYVSLRVLIALLVAVPAPAGRWICRRLGDLLYDVVRLRRRVVLENLRASFPEKSETEHRAIARECYRSFSEILSEFARISHFSREDTLAHSEVVGRDHLDAALAEGRGVILVSGHLGNWEWLGGLLSAMGYRLHVVAGRQHNPLVDHYLAASRARLGVAVLSAEKDVRGILRALERRGIVAMVSDQDAGRDGVFVDFLGRPASTAVGPVRLARKFGVPIVVGFSHRLPGGRIRLELRPAIHVPKDGDTQTVEQEYTARWSRMLEDEVRSRPTQWFWMHRRWKTRPETVRRRVEEVGR